MKHLRTGTVALVIVGALAGSCGGTNGDGAGDSGTGDVTAPRSDARAGSDGGHGLHSDATMAGDSGKPETSMGHGGDASDGASGDGAMAADGSGGGDVTTASDGSGMSEAGRSSDGGGDSSHSDARATGGDAGDATMSIGGDSGTDASTSMDAGVDAGHDAGLPVTFSTMCGGAPTTVLTGTVLAPNGTDPIPNVRVYAAVKINPFPAQYCDKCSAPIDPAYIATTSAPDGTFTLNLAAVPFGAIIDFGIQIHRFRKHTLLPVTPCMTATVPVAATTLPGTSAAGDIPKIAVSSGNADHLDAVLSALGITEFDCYEGRKVAGASTGTCAQVAGKNIADVISTSADLDAYHMLFLSCAPGAYKTFIGTHNQATMTTNTASWVAAGGRVMATDTAYDYLAQAFPSAITWAGPAGSPQPVDGANRGCSPPDNTTGPTTSYPITVDDPTLATWLKIVGFPTSPSVNIEGFYTPWSLISSLPATTSLIANGSVPVDLVGSSPACTAPTMTTDNAPLTAQFDVPTCGRAVFSSYHTYTGTGSTSSSAQEKIMEYLIFDAATCHE